jgi:hypothetical protein
VLAGEAAAMGWPGTELSAAAAELAAARSRWVALTPGETWVLEWQGTGRGRVGSRR